MRGETTRRQLVRATLITLGAFALALAISSNFESLGIPESARGFVSFCFVLLPPVLAGVDLLQKIGDYNFFGKNKR